MKVRILAILLFVSVLLNAAGLVFFISFNLQGHYKTVRRERNQMAQSITMIRGASLINSATTDDHILKRTFASLVDGQTDNYALILPSFQQQTKDVLLMVYLHGMGSNYLEPFLYPMAIRLLMRLCNLVLIVHLCLAAIDAALPRGNDLALSDITQNIREVCQEFPVGKIVLIGTSMGGCTALTYATVAPKDIKDKIAGIVSVESAGDLALLYKKSPMLRQAMILAFGAEPEQAFKYLPKQKFYGQHKWISWQCQSGCSFSQG